MAQIRMIAWDSSSGVQFEPGDCLTLGTRYLPALTGGAGEVPADVGERWVARGLAELVDAPVVETAMLAPAKGRKRG